MNRLTAPLLAAALTATATAQPAAGLGRPVSFLPLPASRVGAALVAGEADAVCFVLPQWLQGDFRWTRSLPR